MHTTGVIQHLEHTLSQGLSRQGEGEIPESSSKQRPGHLRHDGIHSLCHYPGTKDQVPLATLPDQFTHNEGLLHRHWHYSCLPSTMLSSKTLRRFAIMYTRWALSQHVSQV